MINVFLCSNVSILPVILLNIIVVITIQKFMLIVLIGYILQVLLVYFYLKGKNVSHLFTIVFLINIVVINIVVLI